MKAAVEILSTHVRREHRVILRSLFVASPLRRPGLPCGFAPTVANGPRIGALRSPPATRSIRQLSCRSFAITKQLLQQFRKSEMNQHAAGPPARHRSPVPARLSNHRQVKGLRARAVSASTTARSIRHRREAAQRRVPTSPGGPAWHAKPRQSASPGGARSRLVVEVSQQASRWRGAHASAYSAEGAAAGVTGRKASWLQLNSRHDSASSVPLLVPGRISQRLSTTSAVVMNTSRVVRYRRRIERLCRNAHAARGPSIDFAMPQSTSRRRGFGRHTQPVIRRIHSAAASTPS